jgi:hypothetical protein
MLLNDQQGDGPAGPALFSVNMRIGTAGKHHGTRDAPRARAGRSTSQSRTRSATSLSFRHADPETRVCVFASIRPRADFGTRCGRVINLAQAERWHARIDRLVLSSATTRYVSCQIPTSPRLPPTLLLNATHAPMREVLACVRSPRDARRSASTGR